MNKELLEKFIGKNQLNTLIRNTRGEEGKFFEDMLARIENTIKFMPSSYETEGMNIDDKVFSLHYFLGGSDWYILEKDSLDDQIQAFGFACLNGDTQNAEWGYINIEELIDNNVEMDLYFNPTPVNEILERF